jgi:hypothetical protein
MERRLGAAETPQVAISPLKTTGGSARRGGGARTRAFRGVHGDVNVDAH